MNFQKNSESEMILSIETTVAGGSLALLASGREIAAWKGSREVSKAEDVLEQIAEIFAANKIEKRQIAAVVVSEEDRSTGGKIGLAIAKGLSKSLGCRLIQTSVLESLLLECAGRDAEEYLAAASVGRNQIKRQYFRKDESFSYQSVSDLEVMPISRFASEAEEFAGAMVLAIENVKSFDGEAMPSLFAENERAIILDNPNLARQNGLAAIKKINSTNRV